MSSRQQYDTRLGDRQPAGPGGFGGPGGPSRRTVLVSLLATTALAAVTGAVIGLVRPGPATLTTTVAAPSTAAATASVTTAPKASAKAASPSASPSAKATTPQPDPAVFLDAPWKEGLDFAVITGARKDGQVVQLKVDRLQFLTGSAAKKYYKDNPDKQQQDYAIVNQNPKIYTYTLVPNAPIFGSMALTGNPDPSPISADQLVQKSNEAMSNGQGVYIWMRHQDGGKGWTTYVAEQYLP
jgi:hypothetical protein